ncbi:DNA sulfur modification protein DndD [Fictibacillus nanhaiensis]|uniref:DNA sulfur modification protein DndD n=1 Tax=Fictibacillus nanhaiensis TaxID=742169 RepID=UPI001C94D0A7|nr:DNA sulfur modification protein DndD [Fictibacillus nanhaiensis]MBY6036641.1 DNA sulfur modification protein DndD [Fictibacillus nanhaiensis]
MKFNKVMLNNIGAYKGVHEIDLSVDSPLQNVILFGGENGAGKTTFLNSIRLALFGSYAFGFRTENDAYYRRVKSLLNKNAVSQNESLYQIIIEYSEVENYKRNEYKFIRRWKLQKEKLKEDFLILKNDHYLNDSEKELYHSKLKETVPPQLFDLCLFDGEEISRIVNDNRLSEYLRASAKVMFNLNLFENLEGDLHQLIKQNKAHDLSKEENEILELNEAIEALENNLKESTQTQEYLFEQITNIQEKLSELKRDFNTHGGLVKDKREQFLKEVNSIESIRTKNMDEVRNFISTLLPFYMNRSLLADVKKQMEQEKSLEAVEHLSNLLTPKKLDYLLKKLIESNLPINDDLQDKLLNGLLEVITDDDNPVISIHKASFSQRIEIENTHTNVSKISSGYYLEKIKENQDLLKKSHELRKKIELNDQTTDFKEILENIQQMTKEITILTGELEQKKLIHNEMEIELDRLETEKITKQNKLVDSNKVQNTFLISSQVIELSKHFRKTQQQKKLQQVQIEATKMLNSLMRKRDYVSRVIINEETFEVRLFNSSNEELYKDSLSSGEKEILLLSVVWAMFKSSGRRLPFIFDTLLGRLDKTHKLTVLTQLIPACGEQVIILSTDSEIDRANYELLKPRIAKEYTLEFLTNEEKVKIHNEYFMFSQMGVSQ